MDRHIPADLTDLFEDLFPLPVFTAQVGIITVAFHVLYQLLFSSLLQVTFKLNNIEATA